MILNKSSILAASGKIIATVVVLALGYFIFQSLYNMLGSKNTDLLLWLTLVAVIWFRRI